MHYTAVILDFDGTLLDTRRAIASALITTFVERNFLAPDHTAIWTTIQRGLTLEATFAALLPEFERDAIPDWVTHYRQIYNSGAGIAASAPFDGAQELLVALADDDRPVVVVSNKGTAAVENTLAHFGMRSAVDLIVAADGQAATKPDPASYHQRIFPVLGEKACAQILVVGDTDADIRYARAIGARSCWATFGYGDPALCTALTPDYHIDSLAELAALLGIQIRRTVHDCKVDDE